MGLNCGNCGLPTIADHSVTLCGECGAVLCATCRLEGHCKPTGIVVPIPADNASAFLTDLHDQLESMKLEALKGYRLGMFEQKRRGIL